MAWLSSWKGISKAEDMHLYYALGIGSTKSTPVVAIGLVINLCFYMETMLNQSVYIHKPLTPKKT